MLIHPEFEKILNHLSQKENIVDYLYSHKMIDSKYKVESDDNISQQIVSSGFYLDAGFNSLVFIYKNKFYGKYDDFIILYNEFDLKSPLQIIFSNFPRTPLFYLLQVVYTVFFLYRDHQKSPIKRKGHLMKEIKNLFTSIDLLLDQHEKKEERNREVFQAFEKSIAPKQMDLKEIPLLVATDKKDKLLEIKLESAFLDKTEKAVIKKAGFIGFILKKEDNKWGINPVLVPQKETKVGKVTEKPLKITSLQLSKYELQNSDNTLDNIISRYLNFTTNSALNKEKIQLINSAYFKFFSDKIKEMPSELIFCRWGNKKELPLRILSLQKIGLLFQPKFEMEEDNFQISLKLNFKNKEAIYCNNYEIISNRELFYLIFPSDDAAILVDSEDFPDPNLKRILNFLEKESQSFKMENFQQIQKMLQPFNSSVINISDHPEIKYQTDLYPDVIFSLNLEEEGTLTVLFDYDRKIKKFRKRNPEKRAVNFNKIFGYESLLLHYLSKDEFLTVLEGKKGNCFGFDAISPHQWLVDKGEEYLKKGMRIYLPKFSKEISFKAAKLDITAGSGINWFEYGAEVTLDDNTSFAIKEIYQEESIVVDSEDNIHLLTEKELKKLKILLTYCDLNQKTGKYKLQAQNELLFEKVNEMLEQKIAAAPVSRQYLSTILKQATDISDYPVSPNFKGVLRKYQQHGYNWLLFMLKKNLNCCLADDMGLGKTVQMLAVLQSLKDAKRLKTSLLVLPLVSIYNWEDEIKKFTPGFKYIRYTGAKRKENFKLLEKQNIDLVIISYNILRLDIEILKDYDFNLLILDESQNIKNPDSKISKSAKIIKAKNKICLTGTPMENNLTDLWSMFDLLKPGYLGSRKWYVNKFAFPVEKRGDKEKAEILRKMIFPFILRRTKENVEADLPEKTVIVKKVELNPEQKKVYAEISKKYKKMMKKEIKGKGVGNSRMLLFELLLKLRQFCLFPSIAGQEFASIPSSKLESVDLLMDDILAEKHRVLIFSQFREVHLNLKKHLTDKKIKYYHFDGRTDIDKRKGLIENFQQGKDGVNVFLLSLKAGGVSINLTGADYVFIFDPWWNPAVEAQAIDRAHRIGQTKKVVAYKVITEGTIEEKIYELQQKKKDLYDSLISEDVSCMKKFSEKEILDLFDSTT